MVRRVEVPPQQMYGSVPLELPLIRMSEAEAIKMDGEPQIYDDPYPLDFDGLGLNPGWWRNTGLGEASFGNVAMLPHEIAQMSGLGLTPAQIAAQKKRADAKAAAQQKQAAAVQKRAEAKAAKAKPTIAPIPGTGKADIVNARKTCLASGGKWDARAQVCGIKPGKPVNTAKAQADCRKAKGTWDGTKCVSAQDQCVAGGGYWNSAACIPKVQQDCVGGGGMWDATTGTCRTQDQQRQDDCYKSGGTWANGGCQPPGGDLNAQIAACQAQKGFWDGSACQQVTPQSCPPGYAIDPTGACVPISNPIAPPYQPPYGGPPGVGPIPPGYDGGGGGGGYSGGGGGMPMSPGMPPGQAPQDLLNESAGQYAPSVEEQTQGYEEGSDTEDKKDKAEDDSSAVAGTNIFESISKLFSGMGGLGCGCKAPPSRIGMGGTDMPQKYSVAPLSAQLKPSTIFGIEAGSALLIIGAAAIFLWSKGK